MPEDVSEWLEKLGLAQYASNFTDNDNARCGLNGRLRNRRRLRQSRHREPGH